MMKFTTMSILNGGYATTKIAKQLANAIVAGTVSKTIKWETTDNATYYGTEVDINYMCKIRYTYDLRTATVTIKIQNDLWRFPIDLHDTIQMSIRAIAEHENTIENVINGTIDISEDQRDFCKILKYVDDKTKQNLIQWKIDTFDYSVVIADDVLPDERTVTYNYDASIHTLIIETTDDNEPFTRCVVPGCNITHAVYENILNNVINDKKEIKQLRRIVECISNE